MDIKDFEPISLVGSVHKILEKVLTDNLKHVLWSYHLALKMHSSNVVELKASFF